MITLILSLTVHLVGKCNGQVFEDRDVSFVMGEGSEVGLLNSVEYAIRKFKKAEKALLTVASRYGYGTSGNTEFNIPPNADLEYEVKLKTFEKVSLINMTTSLYLEPPRWCLIHYSIVFMCHRPIIILITLTETDYTYLVNLRLQLFRSV